jgi:hypothetical protein
MGIDDLVESIVAPFLEEVEATPNPVGEMPYPRIDEATQRVIDLLESCEHEEISSLGSALSKAPQELTDFLSANPSIQGDVDDHFKSEQQDSTWKDGGSEMASMIGYDLIDYVDGSKKVEPNTRSPEVSIELGDEHSFVDIAGSLCEEYSYRDKIKATLQERVKKKS